MQKRTVTVEIDRVLREEAPELQKRYRGLLEGMAKALLAAAQACQAEEDFCSEIDLAASSRFSATGIVRQPFRILGNPAQEWSAVSLWLTEVKRAGYLR